MKKLIKFIGIGILVLLICVITYVFLSVPKLPDNSNVIIEDLLSSELPEFVNGQTGYAVNNGTNIWYESILPTATNKGAILLFMGISNDALGWPQPFIDNLVNSGYQVIRYDYRGTGLSSWVENWEEQPYSLTDLANDGKVILDSLKIEKVNLLGVSLGGMVAQEFAINFPERTSTITSLMSSGNILDKELPPISSKIVFELVKTSMRYGIFSSEKNTIKLHLSSRVILQGDAEYDIDVKGTAEQVLYNLRKRKGYNPNASKQHHEATYRSGSRYKKLKDLIIPVLIMHGVNDPFIPIAHSKKLKSIIPNARTKWFENMGHDIPLNLTDEICKEIYLLINSNNEK
ncbi:alpha/beta fold hydrolase [bacterium]|nr:alpha/beta fold hydrolase [Saprospiraceae bacterium]MDC3253538.1 alpha/beta fold hydrolase [bacterium]